MKTTVSSEAQGSVSRLRWSTLFQPHTPWLNFFPVFHPTVRMCREQALLREQDKDKPFWLRGVDRALTVTRGSRPEDQASRRLCGTRPQRRLWAARLQQTVGGEAYGLCCPREPVKGSAATCCRGQEKGSALTQNRFDSLNFSCLMFQMKVVQESTFLSVMASLCFCCS